MRSAILCLALIGNLCGAAEETVKVDLDQAKLEFRAKTIESKLRKVGSGYAIHEGQLYLAIGDPPLRVLTEGKILIDGKEVVLDVSGLGDPWVDAKVEKRFVRLTREEFRSGTVHTLEVCFAKGGAEDYLVRWVITGGKSIRIAIEGLGDAYPDWVAEPE